MPAANASATGLEDVKIPAPETMADTAKLTFGKAVDHYYAGEVAQALVLFSGLIAIYPDREEIVHARSLCAGALRRATPLPPPASTPLLESATIDDSAFANVDELNSTTVRKFILEKMLHGETELAQIQAAELAGRMVGLFPDERADDLKQAGNF